MAAFLGLKSLNMPSVDADGCSKGLFNGKRKAPNVKNEGEGIDNLSVAVQKVKGNSAVARIFRLYVEEERKRDSRLNVHDLAVVGNDGVGVKMAIDLVNVIEGKRLAGDTRNKVHLERDFGIGIVVYNDLTSTLSALCQIKIELLTELFGRRHINNYFIKSVCYPSLHSYYLCVKNNYLIDASIASPISFLISSNLAYVV